MSHKFIRLKINWFNFQVLCSRRIKAELSDTDTSFSDSNEFHLFDLIKRWKWSKKSSNKWWENGNKNKSCKLKKSSCIHSLYSPSFYFLFFCRYILSWCWFYYIVMQSILIFRGFKTTGPFVTMIYRMTANDLLRFVIIYIIFVMGFAQCKILTYQVSQKVLDRNLA